MDSTPSQKINNFVQKDTQNDNLHLNIQEKGEDQIQVENLEQISFRNQILQQNQQNEPNKLNVQSPIKNDQSNIIENVNNQSNNENSKNAEEYASLKKLPSNQFLDLNSKSQKGSMSLQALPHLNSSEIGDDYAMRQNIRKRSTHKKSYIEQIIEKKRSSQIIIHEEDEDYKSQLSIKKSKTIKELILYYNHKAQLHVKKFLEHWLFSIFITIVTVFSLFGDDIRVLSTDKDGDETFNYIFMFMLCIFGGELLACSYSQDGYFLKFYFWLDFISTASLIFDISWISNEIFDQSNRTNIKKAAQLARASRAAKIGARAGRIVRIVRLVRLMKLYKHAQEILEKQLLENEQDDDENKNEKKGFFSRKNQQIKSFFTKKKKSNKIESQFDQELPEKQSSQEEDNFQQQIEQQQMHIQIQQNSNDQSSSNQNQKESSNLSQLNKQPSQIKKSFNYDQKIKSSSFRNLPEGKSTANANQNPEQKKKQVVQETKIGEKLNNLTLKRVITIVMAIMFSIPLFDKDTYWIDYTSFEAGLDTIYYWHSIQKNTNFYERTKDIYIDEHKDMYTSLIYLEISQVDGVQEEEIIRKTKNTEAMRFVDQQYNSYEYNDEIVVISIADLEDLHKLDAILSIIRTVLVCIILVTAAILFQQDLNNLILHPISNMVKKVQQIGENPLKAVEIEEQNFLTQLQLDKEQQNSSTKDKNKKVVSWNETNILEKTIIKIGTLLAIGFGEAGSEIIAKNMEQCGEINPLIPGKKQVSIFGFCDIRNFTDATEILQEKVMQFVNEIADIVHSTVTFYCGSANKNIGDAFLFVWKFPPTIYQESTNSSEDQDIISTDNTKQFCDLSLIAFVKILGYVYLSKKLKKYRKNKDLNARMPNYRVKLGMGLHIGWAIEGAIGSSFKIDASYLSPHVNMASNLEGLTKEYGVPLLISGEMYKHYSHRLQRHIRKIDSILLKGAKNPLELYTCDLDFVHLKKKVKVSDFDRNQEKLTNIQEQKKDKLKKILKKKKILDGIKSNSIDIYKKFFKNDAEIRAMRSTFSKKFYDSFKLAFALFSNGQWNEALPYFEECNSLCPLGKLDGPSNKLISVIKQEGGKVPSNWQGYRLIDD